MNLGQWWTAPDASHAFDLAWISVLIEVIATSAGLGLYFNTRSSLILCYALENLVDSISSLIVLWRFFLPGDGSDADRVAELAKREEKASLAVSIILFLLGLGVISSAIYEFQHGFDENADAVSLVLGISLSSIVVFSVLTIIKFQFSVKLNSPSMKKDGFCSLFGVVLSASLFFNTLLITENPGLGFVDPLVALLVGCTCSGLGFRSMMRAIFVHKNQFWRLDWWLHSKGKKSQLKSNVELSEPTGNNVPEVV
eukprot:CAMPEP_0194363344 /NCGR_PEP_ID=MMETSP0174-20130528/11147_1 /TAXON_ID=216777 /ORGANISM="Proboscia alata, Strain PI-D3" /LENGTH=253 /DNA_ID=CAMNT_0039136701 /DNA_START=25 /DNA_END=786 /DNA_ORIENTATION=+